MVKLDELLNENEEKTEVSVKNNNDEKSNEINNQVEIKELNEGNGEISKKVISNEVSGNTNEVKKNVNTKEISIKTDFIPFDEILKKREMSNSKKAIKKKNNLKHIQTIIDVICLLRDTLVCITVAFVISVVIIRPIKVNGSSMSPTLVNNDIGLSNIIGYQLNGVKRFDIVVLYEDSFNEYLVKRIIGMPNETIAYVENELFINGQLISETFFDEAYRDETMMLLNEYFTPDFNEVVLKDDEYFVMGDNRPYSTDSRKFGVIMKEQIKSKGAFILYPFNHFGSKK